MARVLIVDDDVELSQFLELAVCRRGHEVRVATSRFEAYTVGLEFRPDVLVVDWYITVNFDGFELAQVLREGLPQLQVILITGYPSQTLKRNAAAAEIWPVLAKPFELAELTGAIEDAVARSSSSSRALR